MPEQEAEPMGTSGHTRPIDISDVLARIRALPLPDVDAVVGIGRGGSIPAALVAAHLDRPLGMVRIRYRDDDNAIQHETPRLGGHPRIPLNQPGHVLLVDDVSVTGATIETAREALAPHRITTMVMRGAADLVAFPDLDDCVLWPWRQDPSFAPAHH